MATAVQTDPWAAGIMAAGSVATAALKDNTPMNNAVSFGASFDNSGWVVNTGQGATVSPSADKTTVAGPSLAALLRNPVVLIGLAVAAYYVLGRK